MKSGFWINSFERMSRFWLAVLLAASLLGVLPAPVQSQTPAPDLIQRLKDQTGGSVRIDYHAQTGKVNFIGTDRSASIAVTGINSVATTEGVALGFLNEYGSLFGVSDPAIELTVMKTRTTEQGDGMIRYQQVYRGVPVMGAELTLITDGGSNILSASGEFLPDLTLDVTPTVDAAAAQSEARALVNKYYSLPLEDLTVSEPYLTIYDPAILGGASIRRATLAWRMEVSTANLSPVRELVLVDAANGSIALHFNQIDTALYRKVYDKANVRNDTLPGSEPPTRSEGGAASGITDVNYAYEFSGETLTTPGCSSSPPPASASWMLTKIVPIQTPSGTAARWCTGQVTPAPMTWWGTR
jgi:bacillolysin